LVKIMFIFKKHLRNIFLAGIKALVPGTLF